MTKEGEITPPWDDMLELEFQAGDMDGIAFIDEETPPELESIPQADSVGDQDEKVAT